MSDVQFKKADFTSVPIDEFISGTELSVDLYIELSDSKFIQIAKVGDRVEIDRLVNYKFKKAKVLLIKNEEFSRYINKGLNIAGVILKSHEVPLAQRQTILNKVASGVFSEIEKLGMNHEIFRHSKSVVSATISLCQSKSDLFSLMSEFAKISSGTLYVHSVSVSLISVMLGQAMDWKQHVTIEKLGLGGLLHDIGKKELPEELLAKPRALMTKEELTEYESHPFRGLQILRSLSEVPDDVASIAYEHHENGSGFGFPRHLKQIYINPFARIVGLANEFCHLTMHGPGQSNPKTPAEAINYIESVLGQPFLPDAFKALKILVCGEDKVVQLEKKAA